MKVVKPDAVSAIHQYAHYMDIKRFDLVVRLLSAECDIDYSAVGGPKASMTPDQVREFLVGLLGNPQLSVHTAIQQVLPPEIGSGNTLAYYSVRHFHRAGADQQTFFVYGWYEFALVDGLISRLTIKVQAMTGDPSIVGHKA